MPKSRPQDRNASLQRRIRERIDNKTKPLGALGELETLAETVCRIQRSTRPALHSPHLFLFAGDHGLANDGVAAYPPEVTAQMVQNFLAGGAAINVFARRNGLGLSIVNAGVATPLPDHPGLINAPVAAGTRSSLNGPAMTTAECEKAVDTGREVVAAYAQAGGNCAAFGEMGIGNTSAAALLLHRLGGIPLAACVGPGAGLDPEGVERKRRILERVAARHRDATHPTDALAAMGGFEIAMIVGGMLEAAARGLLILVDGFIVTTAMLVADRLDPSVRTHAVFAHDSAEPGHRHALECLGATPLLRLGMRLGEGTGAALALPLLHAAVDFMNDMASFDDAGVSKGERA